MKKLILATCISLVSISYAAESDWVQITGNGNISYSFKKGSGELAKNDGGEPIYLGVGRVMNSSSQDTKVEVWFVKLKTCAREIGILYTANTNGEVTGKNEFTFGQGSIAADIGETLCALAKRNSKTSSEQLPPEKGLKKNV